MPLRPQSLPALGVFSVAARHQNLSHAAEELHLTASAVSHHIRQLERTLGVSLFQRHARGVILTPSGRALADAASSALAEIGAVSDTFRMPMSGTTILTIASLHSLVYCWLLPRLARFSAQHPEVRFRIETSIVPMRFGESGPDIAVRYGAGEWPGLTAYRLMDEHLFPVAAPDLPGFDSVKVPADILRLPLIHDMGLEGWTEWFRAAGVRSARIPTAHIFSESTDAMRAAVEGLGASLIRSRLGTTSLHDGHVARLPGPTLKARFSYYALHPAHKQPAPLLSAFIEWLRAEAHLDMALP